jgi:carnitine O-acetyltransferase
MSSTYTTSNGVKIRYPGLPASLKEKFVPGKMYKYQNDVQRLPVMPLKHILDNYLLSVQPLMSNQEMTKTRQVVEEFGKAGGIGEMLHKKLVERSQTHESWVS